MNVVRWSHVHVVLCTCGTCGVLCMWCCVHVVEVVLCTCGIVLYILCSHCIMTCIFMVLYDVHICVLCCTPDLGVCVEFYTR